MSREERFKLRCRQWLEKAYSRATKPEQFVAIARLYELLEIRDLLTK